MLAALVCAALVVAITPPGTGGAQTDDPPADDAADARQQILTERAAVAERLGSAEASVTASTRAVADSEAALAALRQTRAEVDAAVLFTRQAREEPLAVRRAVAIEIYMAGDPASTSMINEIMDGASGIDGAHDRALFTSVVDWASSNLDRLDADLERLVAQLADLDAEIPAVEERLVGERQTAAADIAARDALVAQITDLDQRLRTLNRAILTGLPTELVETRPIVIVKIDNVGPARPQQGLAAADIVIEERVEAGLSRLAALFQSTSADPVGPVRSARTSDIHLFANLGAPLFAYSGANLGVGGALAASSMIDVGASRLPRDYYRESSRRAPHNLYTRTSRLWAGAEGGSPPNAIFEFRGDGEPLGAGARPIQGVDINYGSATADFTWAPDRGGWLRNMDGRPHTVVGGAQIAPENVVVRFVDYVPSPADSRSPEAVVTGSGVLWVLTAGHVIEGRWEQTSTSSPTRWLDANGEPLRLSPGRTWIVLPSPGDASLR